MSDFGKNLTTARLWVGSPSVHADLLYLTGFTAPDEMIYLQHGRKKILVISTLEYARALKTTQGLKIFTPEMLGLTGADRSLVKNWLQALQKQESFSRCFVPALFPLESARVLEAAGVDVLIDDSFCSIRREIKTEKELTALRAAQHAAVTAMKLAAETIAHSSIDAHGFLRSKHQRLTSEKLRTIIERSLLDQQYAVPVGTIVSCGKESALPHETGSGPLRANEPIVIDIFPRSKKTGYWGDLTRTFVKGMPDENLRKMYVAVKAAQKEAFNLIRPRVKTKTIHQRVCSVFKDYGFKTDLQAEIPTGFIHSTGHGVGLDIHEKPRVSTNSAALRQGQVITVEPGLYYPDVGGVRIEDTIEVTKEGWRYLRAMSKRMIYE